MHTLLNLFWAFSKIGVLGYGGGPSFVPLIEMEVVNNHKWLTTAEFGEIFAMGNALPGPIATKLTAYIGYKTAGILGALTSLVGLLLPSTVAMILLFMFFSNFKNSPITKGLVRGIKPVVIVLMGLLIWDLIPTSLTSSVSVAILIVSVVLIKFVQINPAYVVVGSLVFGAFFMKG